MAFWQQDPTSLQNMHDIVVPGPAAWWPVAPGWYVLVTVLMIATVWFAGRAGRHWWRNRYRKTAIELLQKIRHSDEADNASRISAINGLLKRVALVVWPRTDVAQLSGERWIDFLKQHSPDLKLSALQVTALRDVSYSRKICDELTAAQIDGLFVMAETWIRRHQIPVGVGKETRRERPK